MELTFKTAELREICENSASADKKLGPNVALRLKAYLADIVSVETAQEFIDLHEDINISNNQIVVTLGSDTRLTLAVANGGKSPGVVEVPTWSNVDRFLVSSIGAENG